jgi:hypothetical protein
LQIEGEGNKSNLNLGEWSRYLLNVDLPLNTQERTLIIDQNTQHSLQGNGFQTILDMPIKVTFQTVPQKL